MKTSATTGECISAVLEHPLVPKWFVIEANRPGAPVKSDWPLRTLKTKGLVTDGVELPIRRRDGKLAGSLSLYCSLTLDAVRLERRGEVEMARLFARRARAIENSAKCRALVSKFKSLRFDVSGWAAYLTALEQADFRVVVLELAAEVESARARVFGDAPASATITATVSGLRGVTAYLIGEDGSTLAVPRRQLAAIELDWIDAPVVVTREEAGSNVILQMRPGIAIGDEDPVVEGPLLEVGRRGDRMIDPYGFAGLTFATAQSRNTAVATTR